jgi:hypothetical protein
MAQTGYRIDTYKNINPYSSTWGNTKQERILDLDNCTPTDFDTEIEVMVDTNYMNDNEMNINVHYTYYNPFTPIFPRSKSLIDWGDGSPLFEYETAIDEQVNHRHTYQSTGIYTVNVKLTFSFINSFFEINNTSNPVFYINKYNGNYNKYLEKPRLVFDVQGFSNAYNLNQPFTDLSNWNFNLRENNEIGFNRLFSSTNNNNNKKNDLILPYGIFSRFNSTISSNFTQMFYSKSDDPNGWVGDINLFLDSSFFSILNTNTNTSISFVNMFGNCKKITGEAMPIINQLNSLPNASQIYKSLMFYNCTSLSDYNQIPESWK